MIKKILPAVVSFSFSATLLLSIPSYCLSFEVTGKSLEKEKLLEMIKLQSRQLEEQQNSLLDQEKQFLQYQQRMSEKLAIQQKNIEELKSLINSPSETKEITEGTVAIPASTTPTKTPDAIEPVGKPPETNDARRPLEVAAIFDQPGVLTPKGRFNIEPSFQYSHSSSDRISLVGYTIIPAITIGLIDVRRISRDAYVTSLTARYGLTNRIELEGRIPYVYRSESASTTPFATQTDVTDSSADGSGFGDIEFGFRYQLNQPTTNRPYYIAGLRVKSDTGKGPFDVRYDTETGLYEKSPTGSGFWGIQPNFTVIFPSDPAVFFGGINYMWNIERDVGQVNNVDYGDFDPGDSYGFNFGMGLALNDKASFSLGYDHAVVMENRRNGDTLPGEVDIHVGSLLVGYSYLYRDDQSIVLSLAAGVTEEAPDVQITVKTPLNLF